MLIKVGGDLLQVVKNKQEMQAHLDLVKTAWNMAIKPQSKKQIALKRFIKKQRKYAPSIEALKGLEWELRRIIKQKDILYPEISNRIVFAEAIDNGNDNYTIRAYFEATI